MRKNKLIFRKIRNILILIMVIIVTVGIYYNIKNSRAEEKTELSLLLQDKDDIISTVSLDIEAVKNKNGTYTVNIPKVLKSKYVKQYYITDNKSIDINTSNTDENVTLTLTQEEVDNRKIFVKYDYKKVENATSEKQNNSKNEGVDDAEAEMERLEERRATLYMTQLINDKGVTVKGYLPDYADLYVSEIQNKDTYEKIIPEDGKVTIENAYYIWINSYDGMYNLSNNANEMEISLKYSGTNSNVVVYNMAEKGDFEKVDSKIENGEIVFNTNDIYEVIVASVTNQSNDVKENGGTGPVKSPAKSISSAESDISLTASTGYNYLRLANDEREATSPFLGNSKLQRQYIESVTFQSSTSGANSTKWDVSANQNGSILAWYTVNTVKREDGVTVQTYNVNIGSNGKIYANQN